MSRRTRLLGAIANERGLRIEERFLRVFRVFPEKPKWWHSIRTKTPEEDRRGIDAVVATDIGNLFIQIKSSLKGKKKFEKEIRKTIIIVLVVKTNETDEKIRQKTLAALGAVRNQLLEKRNGNGKT